MSEYIPAQSISPEEQERFKALRQKSLDNLMEYYLNYAQSKSSSNPENHKALEEKLSNIFLGIERAYSLEKWDIYGRYVKILLGDGTGYLMQLNNNGEKFRINADGRTYVDNILTAKEIRVRTNVWADNVFDDEYELMSLSDVENYINENNHLPKVPSEAEIVSGELNVGEMQRLQMEKIEELTLYVIEQEKEIKDLNERLERLELLVQN